MTGPEEGGGGGGGGGGEFHGKHAGDRARGRKEGQFLGKHAGDWTTGKTGDDRKVIKMKLPTMDSGYSNRFASGPGISGALL